MTELGSNVGQKTESKSNHCYFSMHTTLFVPQRTMDRTKKNSIHKTQNQFYEWTGRGWKKNERNYKTFRDPFYEAP